MTVVDRGMTPGEVDALSASLAVDLESVFRDISTRVAEIATSGVPPEQAISEIERLFDEEILDTEAQPVVE